MIVRFISDLHLGHSDIAKERGFIDDLHMLDYLTDQWNSVVENKDLTFILGDVTFGTSKEYKFLDQLNGSKHIILGNHDKSIHLKELSKYVDSISGVEYHYHNDRKYILTHIPIHSDELGLSYNIHGHIHNKTIVKTSWCYFDQVEKEVLDERYLNAYCELLDYTPMTIDELL